jgi:hypothetical protein
MVEAVYRDHLIVVYSIMLSSARMCTLQRYLFPVSLSLLGNH